MTNAVYKYSQLETNLKTHRDYTSVYYGGLFELLQNYKSYFMNYSVADDEKIENISYALYGSENYADVILLVNNEVFLWGLPYNSDVLYEQTETMEKFLRNQLNMSSESVDFEDIMEQYKLELESTNSIKRTFRVPKPESMNDVLRIINKYRTNYTFN